MESMLLSGEYVQTAHPNTHHYHDCHQILCIIQGQADVTVNGIHYTAGQGDLVIFSRFETHSVTATSREYARYVLQIAPLSAPKTQTEYQLFSVLSNRPAGFTHVLHVPEAAQIAQRMVNELQAPGHFSRELQDLFLQELLILIYRHCPVAAPEGNTKMEMVAKVQSLFASDICTQYTLDMLAEHLNVSKSSLAHEFKRVTGMPVMEYLLSCRLAAAKKQLVSTGDSIGKIVEDCGFTDSSNFSRTFRKMTGLSPSNFRKKYR